MEPVDQKSSLSAEYFMAAQESFAMGPFHAFCCIDNGQSKQVQTSTNFGQRFSAFGASFLPQA
jgi:hypothetical protein